MNECKDVFEAIPSSRLKELLECERIVRNRECENRSYDVLKMKYEAADEALCKVYKYAKTKLDDSSSAIVRMIDSYRGTVSDIKLEWERNEK